MGGPIRLRLCFGAGLFVFAAAAIAQNAMTTEPADLYAGPDDAYPVVAQLYPNTPIEVYGCLSDWSWCDVGVDDSRGWMYSPDITYQYEGEYVPLYSYAPSLGIAIVPFSVDVYWSRYYHDRPWYSRREEWAQRRFEHRRPPGPPPSAGPPPRPDRSEGPREAARPDDRQFRLGRAEPPHEAPPVEEHNAPNMRQPEPPAPEPRPEPRPGPRPEQHAAPPAAPPHVDRPPPAIHAGPGREERPRPAEPAAPAGRERDEHPH
jgi:uncharacterized protein YraI